MTSVPCPQVPTKFYKHVVVDIQHPYMKTVVGKNGKHFKHCCKAVGVDKIWFNMNKNVVEIWGPVDNLNKASSIIENKIQYVKNNIAAEELKQYTDNLVIKPDVFISGSLDNALDKNNVKYLIGKNGSFFKNITRNADVSFIWYNEQAHTIDIWGPSDNIQNAVTILFDNIQKVNNKILNKTEQSNDTLMELC